MLLTLPSIAVLSDGLPAGYILRGATLDDVPATTAMLNAWARHVLGIDDLTEDSVRVAWTTPQLDLAEDTRLILAPDGQIVGFAQVWGLVDPYARMNVWLRVHPDYQPCGLEAVLLQWAEERVRQVALARAASETRICLTAYRPNIDAVGKAAFEQAGFTTVRFMHRMRIDLDDAPPQPIWPEGVTARLFVPGRDEAAVIRVLQATFRDHWGYVAPSAEEDLKMLQHWMTDPVFDPALLLLAMVGEQLAGISLNALAIDEDPKMGWIGVLGVLREYRQRGIARALLLHSFDQFYQRGQKRAGLMVDTQNLTGALRLCEGVGMRAYRTTRVYEKELRRGVELSTQTLAT